VLHKKNSCPPIKKRKIQRGKKKENPKKKRRDEEEKERLFVYHLNYSKQIAKKLTKSFDLKDCFEF
jgi:hypothetical protein